MKYCVVVEYYHRDSLTTRHSLSRSATRVSQTAVSITTEAPQIVLPQCGTDIQFTCISLVSFLPITLAIT